ncbi:sensor histidine kinase [Streptomyces griseorubiginosus]|uniref:sensor histidine kinase n=1 Tax=Streptomyces griseorubiginosus TaxID=67304 RepID=UPI002E817CE1|nr:histidine kinase [Streptomyces griseorubiginosus]WUB42663.1 histidine kinase [Streptomyces griseorubiginosus]WUB51182.1 histidine kinase [Streptomyces griseorubiginosus]
MSSHRSAAAGAGTRGTAAVTPSLGFGAAWAHPLLGRLLRDQGRRQRLDRRHPWLLDTTVVLAVVLFSLPVLLRGDGNAPFGDTTTRDQLTSGALFGCHAALIVPLWWRRKAPALTYFVIAAVSLAQWTMGVWLPTSVSALIALYTLARNGSLRALGWAAALTVVEGILVVFFLASTEHPFVGSFFLLATVTAAIAVGLTLRIRRMYLAALEDRARRLEIEQHQRMQLTAAAERSRVAREMHDIVGHNLSVMVSLADGAATLAANRNEQSTDALRILADTGRQAMSELRRVLGVLREERDGERTLSPQPGIRDLDPLLARVRAAGLRAAYRTVGDLDSLGSGVQLTVYRIVQESLTNTLRHAGTATTAEVDITAEAGEVRIRVADTGRPPGSPPPPKPAAHEHAPGHGLVGIRQRAAMYRGTVIIGPRDTGHGWVVDVVLEATPAPEASGELPR